jgi:hypothetical protein
MAIARRPISGHVFRVSRKRGDQWYAKYRLPDGRQVQKRIGPHWSARSAPPDGHFTKRTAQGWLDDVTARARRGELPGMVQTGTTFASACDEWLQWKRDRGLKPSTIADYEHMMRRLKPAMADVAGAEAKLEDLIAADIEAFARGSLPAGLQTARSTSTWASFRTSTRGRSAGTALRSTQSRRSSAALSASEATSRSTQRRRCSLSCGLLGPSRRRRST